APEAGTGLQYIHVFKINDPVASFTWPLMSSNLTTLAYISGAPNNVVQTVNISVAAGDVIGILGAVNTTMDNSYSSTSANLNTFINGLPVTLGRLLYQGSIAGAAAPNYSYEA